VGDEVVAERAHDPGVAGGVVVERVKLSQEAGRHLVPQLQGPALDAFDLRHEAGEVHEVEHVEHGRDDELDLCCGWRGGLGQAWHCLFLAYNALCTYEHI
jgi:hypothetical protein